MTVAVHARWDGIVPFLFTPFPEGLKKTTPLLASAFL